MKTFREKLMAVLIALGFVSKQKEGKLTNEDMDKVVSKYNEDYKSDFYADMKADQEQAQKAAALDAAMAVLAQLPSEENEGAEGPQASGSEKPKGEPKPADVSASIQKLIDKNSELEKNNKDLADKVEKLSKKLEDDKPQTAKMKVVGFASIHTDKHAFGIEHSMFSLDHRWNKITVNPKIADSSEPTEDDEKAFRKEVNAYGASLAKRYFYLKENNLLDPQKLMAATEIDLTQVGTELGNYYMVRRQDALIAQLLTIKTVYDFFPRRYGIQDIDVINNVLFTEVSQAWQKGRVFKGSAKIQPERGHVTDGSIKLQFEPLVEMERNYLGYKNTEGSDPVKWGMIEWYAFNILSVAITEQTQRRVMGCEVEPETGTPGKAINLSSGVIFTIIRYFHRDVMLLFSESALANYDSTTMLATVNAFIDKFHTIKGEQRKDDFTLVLNLEHQPWWIKNVRAEYGKDTDFTGPKINVVPDYNIPIYWCAGMGNRTFMILTKPGNLQALENLPGEMLALKFETDFEDVLVRSRWKEGFSAAFVGPKFATAAELLANNFKLQQIFMNKPATVLADDAVALDGSVNFWFLTQANTTAGKKIVDLPTGSDEGQVYILEVGSMTNPQSIDKANNYAGLTANFVPAKVGDYIMFTINAAGTGVRELERKVNGVRTVNKLVQPKLPESRS
ncbi:MAG: hypothetical protein AB2L24_21805 [Mangrovibacterium sp.]